MDVAFHLHQLPGGVLADALAQQRSAGGVLPFLPSQVVQQGKSKAFFRERSCGAAWGGP